MNDDFDTGDAERDMSVCIMPWHDGGVKKVKAEWICHDYGCESSPFCSGHVSEMLIDIANGRQKMFAGLEPIRKFTGQETYSCDRCGRIVMVVLDPLQDEGQIGAEYERKLATHNNLFHSE